MFVFRMVTFDGKLDQRYVFFFSGSVLVGIWRLPAGIMAGYNIRPLLQGYDFQWRYHEADGMNYTDVVINDPSPILNILVHHQILKTIK